MDLKKIVKYMDFKHHSNLNSKDSTGKNLVSPSINKKRKSADLTCRREFLKTVALGGTGIALVPSFLNSCATTDGSGKPVKVATSGENLLNNGDFSVVDPARPSLPAGWQAGPQEAGDPVTVTGTLAHSGDQAILQHRTGTGHFYYYLRQQVELVPGGLYRLRFYARADEKAQDMAAVCLSCQGVEGPAWLYQPLELAAGENWQEVDVVFRAQSGFNALHTADVEFRLHQWRPDVPFRPVTSPDRGESQKLYIDSASLVCLEEGERVLCRMSRWLRVPGHEDLRMAELQPGLGDGIAILPGSLELMRNGSAMRKVDWLEEVCGQGDFAWSERSNRIYVRRQAVQGRYELTCKVVCDPGGDALLGKPSARGRALHHGFGEHTRVVLQTEAKPFDRKNWPVTQGVPFPVGAVADPAGIRLRDPEGGILDCQVTPSSYWGDDSLRWALLDFCVDIPAGQTPAYTMEYGPGISRHSVNRGITMEDDGKEIRVDAGRVRFRVSRERFRFLEDLQVDGRAPLDGPAVLSVSNGSGKQFRADTARPYSVVVEESGPMRGVIAVHGWNGHEDGERFLTYTTRIHVYRNQPFVKVFHTLTNRHEQQQSQSIRYTDRRTGFPEDGAPYKYRNLPGRGVSDASLFLPVSGADHWVFAGSGEPDVRVKHGPLQTTGTSWDENIIRGRIVGAEGAGGLAGTRGIVRQSIPVLHRQKHHQEGFLRTPGGTRATEYVPGVVRLSSSQHAVTAAIYRYSNLFPKETRFSNKGLELGLIPFNTYEPHPLLKGTARTTELLLDFDRDEQVALDTARSFTEPTILTNRQWYCSGRGFMGDPLVPANKYVSGTYDRIIESYVENNLDPYPKGRDDCGMANYGDFLHSEGGGYNDWLNLEYDGDLGLYIHFARTDDRRAWFRGVDASRHFMDSDTGWYTGNFNTHGGNFPHNVAHYSPTLPAGHLYTLGLIHYYVLTGDRRALEATRLASDCACRALYHRARILASIRSEENIVGPHRSHNIPGGSGTSIDSRNFSDPARYLSHSYLVTGEARFLEGSASLCDALVRRWPRVWRKTEDYYIHYRWQQVLGRLYELTGADHYRDILIECGKWTLEEPYARYGEFRVAQSYGRGPQVPGRTNNTRNLFLTFWAWKITGERRYLDWMINMFDAQVERRRNEVFNLRSGKSFGKEADNPARGLARIAPYRMVLVEPSPERFHLVPPAEQVWKFAVGNTSQTPLTGKVEIGPLPSGVEMETDRNFKLALEEEITLEFPIRFTEQVSSGRLTIPYKVLTRGTDGRQGERNGFFAAHLLRLRTRQVPKLIFHAPMNDTSPAYALGGDNAPVLEREDFVQGHLGRGRAFGPNSEGWSFDVSGSIFADAGTISVWINSTGKYEEHSPFRVRGHGWLFFGIFTHSIYAGNQSVAYDFSQRPNEWIHVALKWDLQELGFYVDGELLHKEKRTHYEIPTGEIWGQPMDAAAFDDIRIYSVPLNNESIAALAEGMDIN